MTMTPAVRKLVLTAHVTSSVGWLGAVVAVLALAITGVATRDAQAVPGVYVAMKLIGWFVLVPLSVVSLCTGLAQSLGTQWGLFQHYWVVLKLVINAFSVVVLLMYMSTLSNLADVARESAPSPAELDALQSPTVVLHAGVALVLLLGATVLSVYKPKGLTRFGQRKRLAAP